jgi:HEAT repeat protein
MVIGTHGCNYDSLLVISGQARGRVVYAHYGEAPPYFVPDQDFLSWYDRWLDELLRGYKIDSFGYGPAGGEENFIRVLDDPRASDDLKAEAAVAFCRLPRLSDAVASRIPAYCSHPAAGVRSGACATIRAFKICHAVEEAARLLGDPSPWVRRQAVWTVMEIDPHRWTDAVLRQLREDPDREVATSAFFKLKGAGALPKPELLRIIEQSPLGHLRYHAAYAVSWAADDLSLLIRMLTDSNTQVRFYATLGLRQLKARDALPQVLDLLAREKDALVIGSILKMIGEFGDPSTVPTLLGWTEAPDDFHRLDAIEALAKIGDERAVSVAQAMLREDRRPVRRRASGGMSSRASAYSGLFW